MLEQGQQLTHKKITSSQESAASMGSGGLEVFATPALIAFMENTAFTLAEHEMNEGETTVGISVNIKHTQANLADEELECTATLRKVEGKKLTFDLKVTSERGEIGSGVHERYIINSEKFLGRLKNK